MARQKATQLIENESIEDLLAGKRPKKVALPRLEELLRTWPDHAGTKLYCYRLKNPEIDLSLIPGRKGINIAILQSPYPADIRQWFLENHGGGTFEVKFNDTNQDHAPVSTTVFEIPHSEAEPIVDVRSIVRGPVENEQLIQKWLNEGKITQDQAGTLKPASGTPGAPIMQGADGTPQSVLDLMSHTYKKAFDMAIQQNDPLRMLQILREVQGEKKELGVSDILQLAKDLRGEQLSIADVVALVKAMQPEKDSTLTDLLKEMREDRKILMDRLLNPQQGPSGLGQMKEFVELVTTMREEFGVATPARASSGGGWIEGLKAIAPALAPALAPLAMRLLSPGPQQPATPPQPAAPGATPARGAAGPQPVADPVQQQMQQGNRQLGTLIERCLKGNLTGEELASTINVQFGMEAYQAIKAMGADQIKANLQQHAPDIWQRIEGHHLLDELLGEFLMAYEEDGEPKHDGAPLQ